MSVEHLTIFVCDRCGRRDLHDSEHPLPHGWLGGQLWMGHGISPDRNYCPDCMAALLEEEPA